MADVPTPEQIAASLMEACYAFEDMSPDAWADAHAGITRAIRKGGLSQETLVRLRDASHTSAAVMAALQMNMNGAPLAEALAEALLAVDAENRRLHASLMGKLQAEPFSRQLGPIMSHPEARRK